MTLSDDDPASVCTNRPPRFDPPDPRVREVRENLPSGTNVGARVIAIDPHGDDITYELTGSAHFDIDDSGQITTTRVLDRESIRSYSVSITPTDEHGLPGEAVGVTVTVTDVNEPPDITDGPTSASYEEGGTASVATYTATDPDGDPITWSLPNTTFETDRSAFSISGIGELRFNRTPNYESPHDSDRNNVYKITVRASDGSLSASRNVTVTVTDGGEPPEITGGPTSPSYGEGETTSVGMYTADGDSISWSLPDTTFETDRSDFSISSSGVLSFNTSPDYENPHDSDRNNVYKVTVRASNDDGSDDRNVTVTVTNRSPTISSGSSSASYAEGGAGAVATYVASDPGGGTITWSLPNTSFETDRSDFSISSGGALTFRATPNYEEPHDSNRDNTYTVTVRASDGILSVSRDVTVTVTDRPEAPVFPDSETGRRSVPENTPAGEDFGDPVAATDPEGDPITYSLVGGDTAAFSIVSTTGQLQTKSDLNHEEDDTYHVTVAATDDTGRASRRVITVNITDVDECPERMDAPTVSPPNDTDTDKLRVTWTAPANTGPPITGYAVLYKKSSASVFTIATANTPNLEWTLTGLEANTEYDAAVRAMNAECDTGPYSEAGSGRTNAQATPVLTISAVQNTAVEGSTFQFDIQSDIPLPAAIRVNLSVRQVGDYLDASRPLVTPVPMAAGSQTARVEVHTRADNADEMDGSITVVIEPGGGYTPERTLVPPGQQPITANAMSEVTDDDVPPVVTNVRVNGVLVVEDGSNGVGADYVTLRWDSIDDARKFKARFIPEDCVTNIRVCAPDAASAWTEVEGETGDGTAKEARIDGLATGMLYRVEVKAVVVDESRNHSVPAFVYPTDAPISVVQTTVAGIPLDWYQEDSVLDYYLCTPDLLAMPDSKDPQFWPPGVSEVALDDALGTIATAVDWDGQRSIVTTRDRGISSDKCRSDPGDKGTNSIQVAFLSEDGMDEHCNRRRALGCWTGVRPNFAMPVPRHENIYLRTTVNWATLVPGGGCNLLQRTLVHEAWHAYGARHGSIIDSIISVLGVRDPSLCGPSAYDIAAVMANYAPRQ